jgi:acetylornithine deacetylase/succinyl-diaminopimelate desuccinylase-like protein
MGAARRAIEQAFGSPPVMIREGGSIPVAADFSRRLRVDTLLLGWGQNTDNAHGPNEHFSLADFHRGTRACAHLWHELTAAGPH